MRLVWWAGMQFSPHAWLAGLVCAHTQALEIGWVRTLRSQPIEAIKDYMGTPTLLVRAGRLWLLCLMST